MAYQLQTEDGKPVSLPSVFEDFRGDFDMIVGFTPGRHVGSTGRVITEAGAEYYPSVFNLQIVEVAA